MNLNNLILELNNNLSDHNRANCFNAVELYWQDSKSQKCTGPQEFVEYVSRNFQQIDLGEPLLRGDVSVVWSRSDFRLPLGKIELEALASKREGYPFGLIIEHSVVHLDEDRIFHKPDPQSSSAYQVTTLTQSLSPYSMLKGFELTRHRRLRL
jgi:hypothetical protein